MELCRAPRTQSQSGPIWGRRRADRRDSWRYLCISKPGSTPEFETYCMGKRLTNLRLHLFAWTSHGVGQYVVESLSLIQSPHIPHSTRRDSTRVVRGSFLRSSALSSSVRCLVIFPTFGFGFGLFHLIIELVVQVNPNEDSSIHTVFHTVAFG